jgi:hypothetical protein
MHFLKRFGLISLVAGTSLLAACGDDEGGGDVESGDIPPVYDFSALKIPFESSEKCKATFSKKYQDTSPVTTCRCDQCLDKMQECEAVPGCVEIMACSNRTGCRNEFDCYLFPGAGCQEVIDRWGNSSLATAISIDIMACTDAKACR